MSKLNLFQIQMRWSNIKHLREEGFWKDGAIPSWVDDVLQTTYHGLPIESVGVDHLVHSVLWDLTENLLRIVGELRERGREEEERDCGCVGGQRCEECQGDTAVDEAEYKYGDR